MKIIRYSRSSDKDGAPAEIVDIPDDTESLLSAYQEGSRFSIWSVAQIAKLTERSSVGDSAPAWNDSDRVLRAVGQAGAAGAGLRVMLFEDEYD